MKIMLIAVATAAGVLLGGTANAAVDAAKAKRLAQKYNCLACHCRYRGTRSAGGSGVQRSRQEVQRAMPARKRNGSTPK